LVWSVREDLRLTENERLTVSELVGSFSTKMEIIRDLGSVIMDELSRATALMISHLMIRNLFFIEGKPTEDPHEVVAAMHQHKKIMSVPKR